MTKTSDYNQRQRVLMSSDNCPNMISEILKNVESWFSRRFINPEHHIRLVQERANLKRWPLALFDTAMAASISIILDNCIQ